MSQIFPRWANQIPKWFLAFLLFGVVFVTFVVWYWFSPLNLEVGYQPKQPVEFSHKLHAGNLGIDCRYCHTGVEKSAFAGVPSTQTCMNCHATIKSDSILLRSVKDSWNSGEPIEWVRVHQLGDYVYFDHSAHIHAGVGCASCHGRVDTMSQVRQVEALSMGWCLDCHRDPTMHLRPLSEVTNMDFKSSDHWLRIAKEKSKTLHPPVESCSGCHR